MTGKENRELPETTAPKRDFFKPIGETVDIKKRGLGRKGEPSRMHPGMGKKKTLGPLWLQWSRSGGLARWGELWKNRRKKGKQRGETNGLSDGREIAKV